MDIIKENGILQKYNQSWGLKAPSIIGVQNDTNKEQESNHYREILESVI